MVTEKQGSKKKRDIAQSAEEKPAIELKLISNGLVCDTETGICGPVNKELKKK